MAALVVPSLSHGPDQSVPIVDGPTATQKMLQSQVMLERMQWRKRWDDTVHNKTEYVRYTNTVVLMLSWKHSDLNQKEIEIEVEELGKVFEQDYGFEVHKCIIDSTDGPRKKLNKDLSTFVWTHDKPDTLLIIYYAGHGSARPAEESAAMREGFMLFDKNTLEASKLKIATIAWECAEDILVEVEHANLLVIFDCCEAGDLCKSRKPARFEYLAACLPGKGTKPAGPKSFTRALIWSLKELRNHERGWYPTSELRDKISKAPGFPKDQHPLVGQRFISPDYIVLAPSSSVLDPSALQRREGLEDKKQATHREYLDLRFEFHEHITDEVFVRTGRALQSLIQETKIKATRITFIEKHGKSRWPGVLHVIKATVRLRNNQLNGNSATQTGSSGSETEAEMFTSALNDQRPVTASSLRSTTPSPPRSSRQSNRMINDMNSDFGSPLSVLGQFRMVY